MVIFSNFRLHKKVVKSLSFSGNSLNCFLINMSSGRHESKSKNLNQKVNIFSRLLYRTFSNLLVCCLIYIKFYFNISLTSNLTWGYLDYFWDLCVPRAAHSSVASRRVSQNRTIVIRTCWRTLTEQIHAWHKFFDRHQAGRQAHTLHFVAIWISFSWECVRRRDHYSFVPSDKTRQRLSVFLFLFHVEWGLKCWDKI